MREVMGDKLPDLKTIHDGLLAGFAEGLGILPHWGAPTGYEEELADRIFREEIGTDAYVQMLDASPSDDTTVSASLARPGGTVRADIRLEGKGLDRIREALVTGDFFVMPPRLIFDLEAALRGVDVAAAGEAAERYFAVKPAEFLSVAPGDFRQVIEMALKQRTSPDAGRVAE
jgi:lipoate-protein ligase A